MPYNHNQKSQKLPVGLQHIAKIKIRILLNLEKSEIL